MTIGKDMNVFVSMILGGALGDQYGLPLEMMPREIIRARYPDGVNEYILSEKVVDRPMTYSDDTQMTLSLLDHMVRHPDKRTWTRENMMRSWLRNFEPSRGYSRRTYELFSDLISTDLETLPEGERRTTNGGLMRISPLVRYLCIDAKDDMTDEDLMQMVQLVHYPTHMDPETCFVSLTFLRILQCIFRTSFVVTSLSSEDAGRIHKEALASFVTAWLQKVPPEFENTKRVLQVFLDTAQVDEEEVLDAVFGLDGILAHESLGAVMCCLKFHLDNGRPQDLIKLAIGYGGDCDTIASLVGQCAGLAFGRAALTEAWLCNLENRAHIESIAMQAWRASIV